MRKFSTSSMLIAGLFAAQVAACSNTGGSVPAAPVAQTSPPPPKAMKFYGPDSAAAVRDEPRAMRPVRHDGVSRNVAAAPVDAVNRLPPDFFMALNGAYYFYVREGGTTFNSIRARIESGEYTKRGVRFITIYCPYKASEQYRGVPAVDFFATNANTGSVADFKAMTTAAHAAGMAVTIYVSVLFVDHANGLWQQAQRDHAAGVDSDAENTFLWEGDPGFDEMPPSGGHDYSETAGAAYATSWTFPAINIGHPAGRAYVERILRFWIDQGVDGFEYDAPNMFWGGQALAAQRALLVEYPNRYAQRTLYLIPEGTTAEFFNQETNDTVGYTHQLLAQDSDDRSFATDILKGADGFDSLEAHLVEYLDARRKAGRGAKAVSTYAMNLSGQERAWEAALLAGAGAHFEIDVQQVYSKLPAEAQRRYDEVFAALARSPAEAPGATRIRLPTQNEDHYAVLRVSADGQRRAINVYNRSRSPAKVRVSVSGHGIPDGRKMRDLVSGKAADGPSKATLTVSVPGTGYRFLEALVPAQ